MGDRNRALVPADSCGGFACVSAVKKSYLDVTIITNQSTKKVKKVEVFVERE